MGDSILPQPSDKRWHDHAMMSNSMVQIEDDLGDLPPNVLITDASETATISWVIGVERVEKHALIVATIVPE